MVNKAKLVGINNISKELIQEKMQEYMESETVKGAFKDAQNSDYVNGSCVFLAGDNTALEIFKKA